MSLRPDGRSVLSTPTLFVALFAAFALFGVTLVVARRSLPESPEVGIWARGTWLLIAGFALLVSRTFGPAWISIIGGNGLVFAGLYFNAHALNRFILRRGAPVLQLALTLLGAGGAALMLEQPLPVRTAVVSLLFALQVAPMAVLVFTKGWHAEPSLRTVGITLGLTVVALAVRAAHATIRPGEYLEFFQVSLGNGMTYLASYLFPLGAGFGFILANLERTTGKMLATSEHLSRTLDELRGSEERYRAIVKDQDDIVCRFDKRGAVAFANDACLRTFGLTPDNLNAKSWESVVVPEDLPAVVERRKALTPANPVVITEHRIVDAQGARRWMEFVNRAFYDEGGKFQGLQTVGRDVTQRKALEAELARTITEQKQYQQRVEEIAFHDTLTGLPNRLLLADRMHQLLPLCERMHSQLGVCFLDLDGFKAVNDEFGHEAGDTLLQEVARRLLACVRGSDTVARIGGDEFVVLLFPAEARAQCDGILQRILAALSEPVRLADQRAKCVSASMGVALYCGGAETPADLLSRADEAMYVAKRAGGNRACYSGRSP